MQTSQNSSPIIKNKNLFLDIKPLKNESQEDITQSNSSLKQDNSFSFGQDNNESILLQNDIWQDSETPINDILEESSLLPFNEKAPNERHYSSINQSIMTIDENLSIDKNLSLIQLKDPGYFNELNEIESFSPNVLKLNEESFISNLDFAPNQDFLNFENDFNNSLMEEGKNDSFYINIKEPAGEIKDKLNLSKSDIKEDKKKEKISFLISKKDKDKDGNISINIENNSKEKPVEEKKKSKFFKNDFIGKKRENENKPQSQIAKNPKLNNLHEINKVTVIHQKAFKCECGKIFSTEENQRLHYINIHLHEKPYSCSFCGEGFSHRNGKIYHERVYHTFIFPYPCKKCSSAFASKSAMIYHMKSKHKVL
jgi:hypothetical protein